jgi:WD40 repeat protein
MRLGIGKAAAFGLAALVQCWLAGAVMAQPLVEPAAPRDPFALKPATAGTAPLRPVAGSGGGVADPYAVRGSRPVEAAPSGSLRPAIGPDIAGETVESTSAIETVRPEPVRPVVKAAAAGKDAKPAEAKPAAAPVEVQSYSGTAENLPVAAVLHPGGRLLLTADQSALYLWDTNTGFPIRSTTLDGRRVRALGVVDGGKAFVAGTASGLVTVDATTLAILKTSEDAVDAEAVMVGADGRRIAALGAKGTVVLWDALAGGSTVTIHNGSPPAKLAGFDGRKVTIVTADGFTRSYDTTGKVVAERKAARDLPPPVALTADLASVLHLSPFRVDAHLRRTQETTSAPRAFSPAARDGEEVGLPQPPYLFLRDGNLLATEDGKTIRIWEAGRWKPGEAYPGTGAPLRSASVSADGRRFVALSEDGAVRLFQVGKAKPIRVLESPLRPIADGALSADGNLLVTRGAARDGRPEDLIVWDLRTGRARGLAIGHAAPVVAMGFRGNSFELASVDRTGTIRVVDAGTGELFREFDVIAGKQVVEAMVSTDGRRLVAVDQDGALSIVDVESGTLVDIEEAPTAARHAGFAMAGRTVLVATEASLGAWDAVSGRRVWQQPTRAPVEEIYAAAGDTLSLTVRMGGDLARIALATGKVIAETGRAADGVIADVPTESLRLFGGDTERRLVERDLEGKVVLRVYEARGIGRTLVRVSGDGRRVVAIGRDGVATLFDRQAGTRLAAFASTPAKPGERLGEWATVTPDGYFVASARGASLFGLVRADQTALLERFTSRLLRPEMVKARLAGDPEGLVRRAAAALELTKLFEAATTAAPATDE